MSYTPPSIGPAGLSIPVYTDIIDDNIEIYLRIYGANQYVGIDSAVYQFTSALSAKQSDTMQALQYVYNQSSPLTAIGAGLDRIVKLNGIARLPYSYSTAVVTLTGNPNTVIPDGVVQDSNGNLWNLPQPSVTIPMSGSINVTATCQLPGNIVAEAGAISIIATPVGGWSGVTNAAASVSGNPVETDSQLRARQAISVALPSKTLLAGTIAALAALPGVTRYNVLENPTGAPDIYGNPAHSITAVVEGGTDQAVAQTIYNNRGIGALTNGTDTVIVIDPTNGNISMPISFDRPTYVPIYVTLNVHGLAGFTSATATQIQTDVVTYLNSLQIGENVIFSELYGAALNARPNPDMPLFSIHSIFSAITPTPAGTVDIDLLFNQVAQGVTANVVVNIV